MLPAYAYLALPLYGATIGLATRWALTRWPRLTGGPVTAAPDDYDDRWPAPELWPGAANPLPGQEPLDLPGLQLGEPEQLRPLPGPIPAPADG